LCVLEADIVCDAFEPERGWDASAASSLTRSGCHREADALKCRSAFDTRFLGREDAGTFDPDGDYDPVAVAWRSA